VPAPTVGVVGMSALRRDINRLADDRSSVLNQQLKAAGKQAAEPVASRTRATVPHDSTTLEQDIRVSGTKTGATVRMGRAKVPYAGWIEFGGSRPDGSTRAYVPDGRYLFPAARGLSSQVADLYSQALQRALDTAPWTNTTNDGSAVHD
jgi:uncharacterized protein YfaQ (DUF2300 family)